MIKSRENIFEYDLHGLLNVFKVNQILSRKHETSYRNQKFF